MTGLVLGPAPPDDLQEVATPEESAAIVRSVSREVVLEAERVGKSLAELGPLCHRRYGRGAFAVHYASLADARAHRCLTVESWLEQIVRQSSSYPLSIDGPVPEKVLHAARAFALDCPEGELGSRVVYRRAAKLLEQLPQEGSVESREALGTYDPSMEICVCGEVAVRGEDIVTVVARMPTSAFAEKQEEQRTRWQAVREHVARLKSWGNQELSDREVGTELAAKTYQEALRILVESELDDDSIELPLRLNLAEALLRLGQYQESAKESTRALELDPGNVKALYRRGRAHLILGEAELARADLMKAALASPQDRDVRQALQVARCYVPQQRQPVLPASSSNLSLRVERGMAWSRSMSVMLLHAALELRHRIKGLFLARSLQRQLLLLALFGVSGLAFELLRRPHRRRALVTSAATSAIAVSAASCPGTHAS